MSKKLFIVVALVALLGLQFADCMSAAAQNPRSSFDAYFKVSDDGTTITDEITVKPKDGKEEKQKLVYHRC